LVLLLLRPPVTVLLVFWRVARGWTSQKEERVFKSKFAVKDISGSPCRRSPVTVVDYDGKARAPTPVEAKYRSWVTKYGSVKRVPLAGVPQ
jgi:hypothetical protein